MSLDDGLARALVSLCGGRDHLLAHAVRTTAPREPLRPLGILAGPSAIEHGPLAAALYRLHPPGTGLTRAAIRLRQHVWMPSIDDEVAFGRGGLLSHHGIRSGAAFPVIVGPRVAAVVEVLSFEQLEEDGAMVDAFRAVLPELQAAAVALHSGSVTGTRVADLSA